MTIALEGGVGAKAGDDEGVEVGGGAGVEGE